MFSWAKIFFKFFALKKLKKPPQKVAYLSRNLVVSEIFFLLPNSPNGRKHIPKSGLLSNCIQNWDQISNHLYFFKNTFQIILRLSSEVYRMSGKKTFQFGCQNVFVLKKLKKPPQKVAYLSRNSVVSEISLLLPNSPNGRSHGPKCGLQSNCIQNWDHDQGIISMLLTGFIYLCCLIRVSISFLSLHYRLYSSLISKSQNPKASIHSVNSIAIRVVEFSNRG